MLILGQFCIIQNIQMSPIPQTSFLSWTFCAASYSKIALDDSKKDKVYTVQGWRVN